MTNKSVVLIFGAVAGVAALTTGVIRASHSTSGFPPQGRGGPMPSLVTTIDANRDGVISAAEIAGAASAMKTLDANRDGSLSGDELPGLAGGRGLGRGREGGRGEGREGGGAPAESADDLTETLMAFDKNGDGKLVKSEVPERFLGLFDRSDANKNGEITRDELKQTAAAQSTAPGGEGGRGRAGFGRGGDGRGGDGRGRGGPGPDPVLAALDTNHDNVLSAAELTAAPAGLRTLDANNDGQLSAEEMRPPFARGRGGRR